jgi:uncharacterized glyoxalase superfamily protein PhnB
MSDEPQFKSLSPVLVVEQVEPCIEFWRDRLGFAAVNEVPEGDTIGFVMLVGDGVTVMYQSRASLEKDIPALVGERLQSANLLYISVSDIDDVERRLEGVDKVVPRRTTFYGATEIGVLEPGGYAVLFAQLPPQ